ncbi:FG-GAP repeat protein [Streptomyces sp. TRM66268-LWL]|uniref:FG-GAP repeat protein n=1 Tax=Streptomyces polyasparticus TaxID=2767826 RepID=A0ABR7SI55_9ACTN|nr:FG-GAP-like repeat-containing protein [Streptomyces polyasparticus]MBC9714647.1 FG-GAP repeat protein [Streptomyces polyasparticus]
MRSTRTAMAAAAVVAATAALSLTHVPTAAAATVRAADDFNGDGYRDLVVTSGGHGENPQVTVVYGTSSGPGTRVQLITQNSPGIPGGTEAGDQWATATVAADLDKDGYGDLVVSSPGEDVGTVQDRGGLTVVWGGSAGLGSGTVFHSPYGNSATSGDQAGIDIEAGDFDGDGDKDLAALSNSQAGVALFKGPFTRDGKSQGVSSLGGSYGYLSGEELAAGNADGSGATDLYVLGRDLHVSESNSVRAFLHRGGSGFAQSAGSLRIPDDMGGQVGGSSLALADFDKDGYGDLAVGRGLENTDSGRGSVIVHYGGSAGINTARTPVKFTQDSAGVPGGSENNDHFGANLTAGDVNGDGYADLAIAAPGEALGTKTYAGTVTVLRGRAGGLSGTGAVAFHQDSSGVTGAAEKDDHFGLNVRLADYTRDGRADLFVSTNEQLGGEDRWGLVHLLKGSTTGTTATGSKYWTLDTLRLSHRHLGEGFLH